MRKLNWLYYIGCIVAPHIMLVTGLVFLSKKSPQYRMLGKNISIACGAVLAIGSLLYYIYFTPMFGLD